MDDILSISKFTYKKYEPIYFYQRAGGGAEAEDGETQVDVKDIAVTDTMSPVSSVSESSDVTNTGIMEPMEPSHVTKYTIPAGTVLYNGTKIASFDKKKIDLQIGDTSFVAMFSPNKEVASAHIQNCAPGTDSTVKGYVHEFIVETPIDNIFILSPSDKNLNWNPETIKANFCNGSKCYGSINGVGFFVINEQAIQQSSLAVTESPPEEQASDGVPQQDSVPQQGGAFTCEFALCEPHKFLKYIRTYECRGPYTLGQEPYVF
jgi:hypothetical protein